MLMRAVLSGRVKPPRRLLTWPGTCAICKETRGSARTVYIEKGPWPRDDLRCLRCLSIPRERCLFEVLAQFRSDWRALDIHESSPGRRGASSALSAAPGYSSSQYLDDTPLGAEVNGVRCEDLSRLTFADETFDLLVTQDVLEHVFKPEKVLAEIFRVLKPGGAHIATFPWYPQLAATRERASLTDAGVVHNLEPQYHRSPVNGGASLVTLDWGADLFDRASDAGLDLTVHKLPQERKRGIDGEFREVFVFTRPADKTA
ncbi:class I SAM-dependent methyltransferase [Nocardioides sp. NPDC092400]|uniref:class I SAM-dependent methyltransferase n=1 Tax=Nocardioides sp. NPDC092400 TaxID=3155196 RepID=UPI0034139495